MLHEDDRARHYDQFTHLDLDITRYSVGWTKSWRTGMHAMSRFVCLEQVMASSDDPPLKRMLIVDGALFQ